MEKWNLGTGKFIFSNTLIKTRVLGVFSRQGLKTVGFDSDPLRCTGGTWNDVQYSPVFGEKNPWSDLTLMLFGLSPESTALVVVKPPVYRAGNEREVFLKTSTTI